MLRNDANSTYTLELTTLERKWISIRWQLWNRERTANKMDVQHWSFTSVCK